MSKHHFLPCTHIHTHTNVCMLTCTDQLLPVLITSHNTVNGYETTVSNWKALYVAMSTMVCLEEQVMFSQTIIDVRSRTWFSEAVASEMRVFKAILSLDYQKHELKILHSILTTTISSKSREM